MHTPDLNPEFASKVSKKKKKRNPALLLIWVHQRWYTLPLYLIQGQGAAKTPISILKATAESRSSSRKPTTPGNMICVQCGRERSAAVARSSKFCTQRCIISWMEANPDKTPKDAMGDDTLAANISVKIGSTPQPPAKANNTSPKSIPRALKNLQIDMAKPGTKLSRESSPSSDGQDSEDEASGEGDQKGKKPALEPPNVPAAPAVRSPSLNSSDLGVRGTIIESLAHIISQQQKNLSSVLSSARSAQEKKLATAAANKPQGQGESLAKASSAQPLPKMQQPPKAQPERASVQGFKSKGAKRLATTAHAPAAKKVKVAAPTKGTPQSSQAKSVSFNLNPPDQSEAIPSSSSIPLSLEKIASYLQPPKKQAVEVKIPSGKPS